MSLLYGKLNKELKLQGSVKVLLEGGGGGGGGVRELNSDIKLPKCSLVPVQFNSGTV